VTTRVNHGLCTRCAQRDPDRAMVRGQHLLERLPVPPPWLDGLLEYLIQVYSPSVARGRIVQLEKVLTDGGPISPAAVLERSRLPGRSMGGLARALEAYFVRHHLAIPTDQDDRLARQRRQRRLTAVPASLRPVVSQWLTSLLTSNQRARSAGTKPRSERTIEYSLTIIRDLALCLEAREKQDWALTNRDDVEAFLSERGTRHVPRVLIVLRKFFGWARTHKVILADPTRGLKAKQHKGFTGSTLTLTQQRSLYRRWTGDHAVHPHEALVGLLALLHGVSSSEARMLTLADIDNATAAIVVGKRPSPVPLDPATWAALQQVLLTRQAMHTDNPHVLVTRGTKAHSAAASTAYMSHVLDAAGGNPRRLRSTRLVDLVDTMDPQLVAAAFGLRPEGVIAYLADTVDNGRLDEQNLSWDRPHLPDAAQPPASTKSAQPAPRAHVTRDNE